MDLLSYLAESPSSAWAAENTAAMLAAEGFIDCTAGKFSAGSNFFVRPHAGMLIAVRLPVKADLLRDGVRLIGAHTDSPHLRLKPHAEMEREGTTVLGCEIYGGALLYTWFDRELGLAGEIHHKDGNGRKRTLIKVHDPVAVVPSLAIHLQRGVNEDGFIPDKKNGLNALVSLSAAQGTFTDWLANRSGIAAQDILSYDLSLFDLAAPRSGGLKGELLHSARLDNLVSSYSAIQALIGAQPGAVQIAALFDHEEIGSVSERGAESGITENLLREILTVVHGDDRDYRLALSKSVFLSADMAHGVHPHHGDRHDTLDDNRPRLGGGVTLKINQNRRYATSAETQALFADICRQENIPSQIYTHRNDLPCGSTIGPAISARLGIPTLDIGVPMLGMHSVRETCAMADTTHYAAFMRAFLQSN